MSTRTRAKPQPSPPRDSGARAAFGRSRATLIRQGTRSLVACAVVGMLTVVAGWHADGRVRRGEIERMLRMSANMAPPPSVPTQPRGKLDRGHLKALTASAGR